MHGAILLAVGLLLVPAQASTAEIMFSRAGNALTIRAIGAPLSRLLEEIGRNTDIAIVYDGPAPQDPVTVSLTNRSGTGLVLQILEEFPCNYAARWDERGARIVMLLLSARVAVAKPAPPVYSVAAPIDEAEAAAAAEGKAISEAENPGSEDSTVGGLSTGKKPRPMPGPRGVFQSATSASSP